MEGADGRSGCGEGCLIYSQQMALAVVDILKEASNVELCFERDWNSQIALCCHQ